jgi:hypothetical protein
VRLPHLIHYFGCVATLPPAAAGEMRAVGVTAHPSVVELYVKQDPSAALKIQPVGA